MERFRSPKKGTTIKITIFSMVLCSGNHWFQWFSTMECIVFNVFRSCYLNRWFCKFRYISVSTIDLLGPGQHWQNQQNQQWNGYLPSSKSWSQLSKPKNHSWKKIIILNVFLGSTCLTVLIAAAISKHSSLDLTFYSAS